MKIYIIINIIILFFISFSKPIYADSNKNSADLWFNIDTRNNHFNIPTANKAGFNFYSENNITSYNLGITLNKPKKFIFDESFLNYKYKNAIIGVGKISRHWSFSPHSSLFLSENARPSESIYIGINNEKMIKNTYLSWFVPSTFNLFNAKLQNHNGPKNSMMLGARLTFIPTENLSVELIKISQWGGKGYNNNLSGLSAAILGNSNEGKNSNINQVAGMGFQYKLNKKNFPIKVYGQLLGEDEAGNLPTCLIYLAGLEWYNSTSNLSTKYGAEFIDTRAPISKNGNCNSDSIYNNSIYSYTNYDRVMGVPLDTEAQSIKFWMSKNLNSNFNIYFSIDNILVNDTNNLNNRISSSREEGIINSLSFSWGDNNIKYVGKIKYQNFNLDQINARKGISFGLNITKVF